MRLAVILPIKLNLMWAMTTSKRLLFVRRTFFLLHIFLKEIFEGPWSFFVGSLMPLFWTSGQVGTKFLRFLLQRLCVMDPSDSPFSITSDDLLVAHMVTKFLTRIRFQAVVGVEPMHTVWH